MIYGLYIHIPFCKLRCYYCDFHSIKVDLYKDEDIFDKYINALIKEIDLYKRKYPNSVFHSLYIGGGTPSILPLYAIDKLLHHLFYSFSFRQGFEFTIEVNPESIDRKKLLCYKAYGVNRLSLGCQTFNDKLLKILGRITYKRDILDKYYLARGIGFDNINLDIIFGLVNQNYTDYANDLAELIRLSPDHISCYSLSINRRLSRIIESRAYNIPDEELIRKEYLLTHEVLSASGIHYYEVSNFARQGKESIHNLNYWRQKDYFGLGISAVGTVNSLRRNNVSDLKKYLLMTNENRLPISSYEKLDYNTLWTEKIMLSLRTKEGLSIKELRGHEHYSSFESKLFKYVDLDLLCIEGDRVYASISGILLLDKIILSLL